MSVENTQQTMEAYLQDLVGGGPYKRHFADDVVVALVGTDQGAEGPDAAEAWINYLHRQAFEARPELKEEFSEGLRCALILAPPPPHLQRKPSEVYRRQHQE